MKSICFTLVVVRLTLLENFLGKHINGSYSGSGGDDPDVSYADDDKLNASYSMSYSVSFSGLI